MKFNMTDLSDDKYMRDRKLFIESFPGEKTFVTLVDNKTKKAPINLLRSVSVNEDQYPIDGDIDFRTKIIPVNIIMGIEKLNDYGAGVFMCVNEMDGSGRKDENVIRIRCCMADWDDSEKDLPEFPLEPSIVVETSNKKYHIYWLSDDIPVEGYRQLQESIIYKLGSDPAVKNPGRPGRLPGFYHQKSKPFMSNIVHYTENKYSFDLLTSAFPPEPSPQFSAPKFRKDYFPNQEEFKGTRGTTKGNRNHFIMRRIGGMVAKGLSYTEIEREVYLEAEACQPALGQFDIQNLLKSARNYNK